MIRILFISIFVILNLYMLTDAQGLKKSLSFVMKQAIEDYKFSEKDISITSYLAEQQLGIPYKAGLLDRTQEEKIIARVDSTDCVLYVENTLAMRMVWQHFINNNEISSKKALQPYLMQSIAYLRYKKPSDIQYMNRLHYFSEWMHHHASSDDALFELPFQKFEELPVLNQVGFMSTKPELYPRLANNTELVEEVREMESSINALEPIRYIPKSDLSEYEGYLKDGDVIAFTSKVSNLDVSHTAILSINEKEDEVLSFYHASVKNGVERYAKGLERYLMGQKSLTGIAVIRLKDNFSVNAIFKLND